MIGLSTWISLMDPVSPQRQNTKRKQNDNDRPWPRNIHDKMTLNDDNEGENERIIQKRRWRTTNIYSSSPPFLERLLLRDFLLFGAAFFLEERRRLEDLRLADLLFGAALRRDARLLLFGAMMIYERSLLPRGECFYQMTTTKKYFENSKNQS